MIEKKIHYCWFGREKLPEDAKKCIKSWKKHMPDFEIVRHDETNFDINSNRYAREAYENKEYAFVSDYARLKIIYDEGGIYFDIDVELIKTLSEEMLKKGFFAKEDAKYIATGLGFAARKGDATVKKMLSEYDNIPFILKNGKFDKKTCPVRNTESVKDGIVKENNIEYIDGKPIYPKEYFAPLSYKTGILEKTERTYAIHFGAATWLEKKDQRILKKRHEYIKKYGKNVGLIIFKIKRLIGTI